MNRLTSEDLRKEFLDRELKGALSRTLSGFRGKYLMEIVRSSGEVDHCIVDERTLFGYRRDYASKGIPR